MNGMSTLSSKQLQALLQAVLSIQTIPPCKSVAAAVAQQVARINITTSPGNQGRRLLQQEDQQRSPQVAAFDRQLEYWNTSAPRLMQPRPSLGPALVALLTFAYQQNNPAMGGTSGSPLLTLHAEGYLAAVMPFIAVTGDGGLVYKALGILPVAEKCLAQVPAGLLQDLLVSFPIFLPMAQVGSAAG
jgi:hypothetical protein